MRLVIACCSVVYEGRLQAHLPLATRLLMVKADGSVLVHSDSLSYKPLNWMSPPCVLLEAAPDEAEQQQSRQRAPRRAAQSHQPIADQPDHIGRPRYRRAREERKNRHGRHGRTDRQKSLVDRGVEIVGFPRKAEKP